MIARLSKNIRSEKGRGRLLRWQGGFSLTELMIASVLTVLIAGFMFSILGEQEKAADKADVDSRMQEQLRFALLSMSRQIRMAGYGVGFRFVGSSLNNTPTIIGSDNDGAYSYNGSTDTTTGTDRLMLFYRNPNSEFELSSAYLISPGNCTDSVLLAGRSSAPLLGNRSNDVVFESGDVVTCFDESRPGGLSLSWDVRDDAILPGDRDNQSGIVIRVQDNGEYSEFGEVCSDSLPVFMTCGSLKGSSIGFYLRHEKLWMADHGSSSLEELGSGDIATTVDIPLAQDIEDFQVAYCVPVTNPPPPDVPEQDMINKTADCLANSDSAYWLNANDIDWTVPTIQEYIRAIRVTLVAKGKAPGKTFVSKRPVVENHTNVANNSETQIYPRMVQSIVVQLPNYRFLKGLQEK